MLKKKINEINFSLETGVKLLIKTFTFGRFISIILPLR